MSSPVRGFGEVARVVVAKYPWLKVYPTQDRPWNEKYHQNMFDAVAPGMMAAVRVKITMSSDSCCS